MRRRPLTSPLADTSRGPGRRSAQSGRFTCTPRIDEGTVVIAACQVRPDYYRDSVFLMRAAQEIRKVNGVKDVGMMMGTAANKRSLDAAGLLGPDAETAGPSDLIVAVCAQTQDAADAALAAAEEHLDAQAGEGGARPVEEASWASLEGAAAADPEANVAMISVPGPYAAAEARRALHRGLNAFLFSDNVPLAAEVELKSGQSAGQLVMGPDCGTAIIDGVPLGFANAVPRGSIGVIGASGTGMQAVTCLLARSGIGISQAIGTGSRDMTAEVGAVSTLQALDLLSRDPSTAAVVLVSKVPSPRVADQVVAALAACGKPGVVNFLGYSPADAAPRGVTYARLLEDVIPQVARLTGGDWPTGPLEYWLTAEDVAAALGRARDGLSPGQDLIRGLYSGGTLCQEANLVLADRGLETEQATADSAGSAALPAGAHCLVDLGADDFTVGRPHPMIDLSLRSDLMLRVRVRSTGVRGAVRCRPGLRRPFRPRDRPGRSRQCRLVSRGGRWPHAFVRRISLRHRGRPAGPAPVGSGAQGRRGGRPADQRAGRAVRLPGGGAGDARR